MWKKGEITVFLSLLLSALLLLFQALFRSAEAAMLRSELQEALELAEHSVLSEYHRGLLEEYDLFYLDLGYGGGAEKTDYLNQRIRGFLEDNLTAGRVKAVETSGYARATDGRGEAYYEQAVSVMKQKTGLSILERFQEYEGYGEEAAKKESDYQEADRQETGNLEELNQRRQQEEGLETPNPVEHTESLKRGSILGMVVKSPEKVSGKKTDLTGAPSGRTLLTGSGPRGRNEPGAAQDALFLAYLMEHFTKAVDFLAEEAESGPWLDYQLEYLIAGKDTDIGNLESVCKRILAIREGMNYGYLLTDGAKVAECEALAIAMVGATLVPGLVEAVKQVLLLGWAFAESVVDVRMLLNGNKVAFYKNAGNWKTDLESTLERGDLSGYDGREDAGGMDYGDYLGILLTLTGREKKIMRSLDAIEGTLRGEKGGSWFYVDQCVDGFQVKLSCRNGQELSAERTFCYEW